MPTLDISQDWQLIDNLQTLQYYPVVSDGVWNGPFNVKALNGVPNASIMVGLQDIVVSHTVTSWNLWKATMQSSFVPKRGDYLTADDGRWDVLRVEICDYGNRYRLFCYQPMS